MDAILTNPQGDYVATATLPPFTHEPECLTWGSRIFLLNYAAGVKEANPIYREVFNVTVINIKYEEERR